MTEIGNEFPPRYLNTGVVGKALTSPTGGKVEPPNLVGEEGSEHRLGLIGAVVADDNQLVIALGLGEDGLYRGKDVTTPPKGRHDDAEEGGATQIGRVFPDGLPVRVTCRD